MVGVGRIKLCQFNSCKKHDPFCTYFFYLIALVRTLRTIFNIPNFSGNTSKFYLTMVLTAFFQETSWQLMFGVRYLEVPPDPCSL